MAFAFWCISTIGFKEIITIGRMKPLRNLETKHNLVNSIDCHAQLTCLRLQQLKTHHIGLAYFYFYSIFSPIQSQRYLIFCFLIVLTAFSVHNNMLQILCICFPCVPSPFRLHQSEKPSHHSSPSDIEDGEWNANFFAANSLHPWMFFMFFPYSKVLIMLSLFTVSITIVCNIF